MNHIETEFKWDANIPRAFFRMRTAVGHLTAPQNLANVKSIDICDVYLDHGDLRFEKQQIAFRIRRYGTQWEATFKTRTEIQNGKAVRQEKTLPLLKISNLHEALCFLEKKKNWQGLSLQGLQPLFSIYNHRRIQDISYENSFAEIAYDSCRISVAGRSVLMKEIELEYKHGRMPIFEKLAYELTRRSGLQLAEISKVKTAYALLRLWRKK